MLVIASGMCPDRSFPCRDKPVRALRDDTAAGIVPLIQFVDKSKYCSKCSLPISVGID